jgi:hypothetical protein
MSTWSNGIRVRGKLFTNVGFVAVAVDVVTSSSRACMQCASICTSRASIHSRGGSTRSIAWRVTGIVTGTVTGTVAGWWGDCSSARLGSLWCLCWCTLCVGFVAVLIDIELSSFRAGLYDALARASGRLHSTRCITSRRDRSCRGYWCSLDRDVYRGLVALHISLVAVFVDVVLTSFRSRVHLTCARAR